MTRILSGTIVPDNACKNTRQIRTNPLNVGAQDPSKAISVLRGLLKTLPVPHHEIERLSLVDCRADLPGHDH
jgi:hypothetical protein